VHETAIDRWRNNNRQKRIKTEFVLSLSEIEEVIPDNSFDEQLDERELSAEISRYLRSVDEVKRNVFIRRYWYYDSIGDICKRYGFGKSKVLAMLKRLRDGLYLHLKKEGYII
jgi:RNA polymerase sigma-70 factor (ECF subfamily)